MEGIHIPLGRKILGLMRSKVLPTTANMLSGDLGVAECRIQTTLKELMEQEQVQLAAGGGWCINGWEGKELSRSDAKSMATIEVDMSYSIQMFRQLLMEVAMMCDKELLHYRDFDIKSRTGAKPKALSAIKNNRRPPDLRRR